MPRTKTRGKIVLRVETATAGSGEAGEVSAEEIRGDSVIEEVEAGSEAGVVEVEIEEVVVDSAIEEEGVDIEAGADLAGTEAIGEGEVLVTEAGSGNRGTIQIIKGVLENRLMVVQGGAVLEAVAEVAVGDLITEAVSEKSSSHKTRKSLSTRTIKNAL